MTESQQQLTIETTLRLLADQQRRQILRWIAATAGEVPVDTLTQRLDEPESVPASEESATDAAVLRLQHVHLPMLEQAGVIVYDAEAGAVQRGAGFAEVLSLLDVIESHRADVSTPSQ